MTERETKELLDLMRRAWVMQGQKLDGERRELEAVYYGGLGDLAFDNVRAAIVRLIRTAKFWPTIAEIREAAGVIVFGSQITGAEAWGSVIRAMKAQGSHRELGKDFVFNDPITALVVRSLSWTEICAGDQDTLTSTRARFIDAYETIAKRERTNVAAATGMRPQISDAVDVPPVLEKEDLIAIAPADERSSMLRDVLGNSSNPFLQSLREIVGPGVPVLVTMSPPPFADGCCACLGHDIVTVGDVCECCGGRVSGVS